MKKKSRLRRTFSLFLVLLLLLLPPFCWWQNNGLTVSEYTYGSARLSPALDGLRIAQVSDLHNKDFHGRLLAALTQAEPDLICVTGDLLDCRRPDPELALSFIRQAAQIAPVFYVSGNHEARLGHSEQLYQELEAAGAVVLDDQAQYFSAHGGSLRLLGAADPAWGRGRAEDILPQLVDKEQFNLLLAHRPELAETYAAAGCDLILSGHAHGGQIRLPLIGGLLAPGQGWFPKYDCGLYQVGNAAMLVSRGLGNSVAPLRLFNRPQLALLTLKSAT